MEENKNLEVVSGDGSGLDISSVHDHLNMPKPKSATERPTNIVIPEATTKDKKNKDDDDEEKKEEN